MMKSWLERVSLVMLGLMVSAPCSQAAGSGVSGGFANMGSAFDIAKSVSGFSGMNKSDYIDKILDMQGTDLKGYSKWLDVAMGVGDTDFVSDDNAYRDIKNALNNGESFLNNQGKNIKKSVQGTIDRVKNEVNDSLKGQQATFSQMDANQLAKDMKADLKSKAKDIIKGKEAGRLLNQDVIDQVKKKTDNKHDGEIGVPTVDVANITVGMFSLDSIFGTHNADEGVREEDTRMCSVMGISPVTSPRIWEAIVADVSGMIPGVDEDSAGFKCCVKWATENEAKIWQATISALTGDMVEAGRMYAEATQETTKKLIECCTTLSPDLCIGVHAQKVECVNNALNDGSSMEEGLKKCAVECGKKGYGEMKHMDVEIDETKVVVANKYDKKQIDDIVKECEEEKKNWAPSPTALSSDEMAPVVPQYAQDKM